MSDEQHPSILELQARWDKIRVANLYDAMDKMGYGDQCIDLSIRPLFPHQHLAGVAVTVRRVWVTRHRTDARSTRPPIVSISNPSLLAQC